MAGSDVIETVRALGARVSGHPERVAEAVGSAWDEQSSLKLLDLVAHSDAGVRRAVARGLPAGVQTPAAAALVAEALISLSKDDDDEVRDWATFGLGSSLSLDTVAIREALWDRLGDESSEVRDEALVGLAHRRDPRVAPVVVARLKESQAGRLVFESAEYLADPVLCEVLLPWLEGDPDDADIRSAAIACDADYQRGRNESHLSVLASAQRLLDAADRGVTVSMRCYLCSTDVLIELDSGQGTWDVDALLERADGDTERAATLIADAV